MDHIELRLFNVLIKYNASLVFFPLVILLLVVAELFLEALSLYSISAINNVSNVSFWKSFKIVSILFLITVIPALIIGLLIGFYKLTLHVLLLIILYIISSFYYLYAFHLLMRRNYGTRIRKNLEILLLYGVVFGFLYALTIIPFWNWFKSFFIA